MMPALSLITNAHREEIYLSAQHISREMTNVFEHEGSNELLLKIVDRFSFEENAVINMTGDATNGKSTLVKCNHIVPPM